MCLRNFGPLHLQIKDCMTRFNGDSDQQRRKKFSFPARLICADCYEVKATIDGTVYLINQTECDALPSAMYAEADCNCYWT
jgi:hypothetical protein